MNTSDSEPTTVTVGEPNYIVLSLDGDGAWRPYDEVAASSGEAAIRKSVKDVALGTMTFVAVPARSWKPVTVRAQQTTVLKIEEAPSS
jgi:hypothetical protein